MKVATEGDHVIDIRTREEDSSGYLAIDRPFVETLPGLL